MFTRAEKGEGLSVEYHRNDGGKLIKTGGTPAWRNNNPGNIRSIGSFASENGSIGEANKFAIFPDYETGRRASARLLRGKGYWDLSIFDAIARYAPAKDKNDVANYRKLLRKLTNLKLERKLKSLNPDEFQKVIDAIQRVEGWTQGSERVIEPAKITMVRRNKKGVIVSYLIDGKKWISKPQLIALIEKNGGVDAVVVYSSRGDPFIRMRPDSTRLNNLNLA